MARSGFVLEVDDRTPPMVVHDGDQFVLERFPLGTSVIYPTESFDPVPDLAEAISAALDAPLDSEPIDARLHAGMRLTLVVDDITTPSPKMRRPDIRGSLVEAVLSRAAKAGVDDVELICGIGLNRRLTGGELQHLLGERVFRSFYADGKLRNHDAEDTADLTAVGAADEELSINARVAASDLVVYVHVVADPRPGGLVALGTAIGGTAAIARLAAAVRSGEGAADEATRLLGSVPVFEIDAVLDNSSFTAPFDFLGKREWEWRIKDQVALQATRRGLRLPTARFRRRLLNVTEAGFATTAVIAGAPGSVAAASRERIEAQQRVEVKGQADVGVIGVPSRNPYSVDSITNPVLAAWNGLSALFGSHTGRPFVREGGALVLFHPLPQDFSPLHHPTYVDFFADVLSSTTEPEKMAADFEAKFAGDPWYVHLYRTSYAFHGLHPFHRWYELAAARAHLSDIVWVGADRATVERLGFRAASTLADALEIVAASVGRTPAISYLHAPPQILVDVR